MIGYNTSARMSRHQYRAPWVKKLNPWSTILRWQLTVSQVIQKFRTFYKTRGVHFRVNNSPNFFPLPSHMSPVQTHYRPLNVRSGCQRRESLYPKVVWILQLERMRNIRSYNVNISARSRNYCCCQKYEYWKHRNTDATMGDFCIVVPYMSLSTL